MFQFKVLVGNQLFFAVRYLFHFTVITTLILLFWGTKSWNSIDDSIKILSPLQLKNRGEFKSRSVKTRDAIKGFHLLENFHKLCRLFLL